MNSAVARSVQVLLCAGAFLSMPAAVAQQDAGGAGYDLSAQREIRGQAVRIWTQPPFIVLAVTDQGGETKNWRLDVGAGQSADTARLLGALKLGDALVVAGNPSTAAGEPRLRATSISRPNDGFVWRR